MESDAYPEALWQLMEMKHQVHLASATGEIVKLATRIHLETTR
jgi:hypothetical protein